MHVNTATADVKCDTNARLKNFDYYFIATSRVIMKKAPDLLVFLLERAGSKEIYYANVKM